MPDLTQMKPFYGNDYDPGPKTLTFTHCDNQEVAAWFPRTNIHSVKNFLNAEQNAVLQSTQGEHWNSNFKKVESMMVFVPDTCEYKMINLNDHIKTVDFGLGWVIERWDIVATDENGEDLTGKQYEDYVANNKPFFICDKLVWLNEAGEKPIRSTTKHGYKHYED